MQIITAARPWISVPSLASDCSSRKLQGCGWRQREELRKLAAAGATGGRHPAAFVVTAFFGRKDSPIKAAGKGCFRCGGKGAVDCQGCQGTGKNKKNGNLFERWKCYDCQGFGLVGCPKCGTGGLTPEQRGER